MDRTSEQFTTLTYTQKQGMTELGLSRAQVSTRNFGYYTVSAIKAEMKKGTTLEAAFEKYCYLTYNQKQGMTELGLSRAQVSTLNFGYHTVSAIKAEIEKGTTLEAAFEKYCYLTYNQKQGMTELGLSREQVLTLNFGDHTVSAIRDIQKRTSLEAAFEMVKGKSRSETTAFVERYLVATKKAQKPISEMAIIRVVVDSGRGFGHQRAAITLMQKLREMGFNGTFDIQCDDRLDVNLMDFKSERMYINREPLVSRQLIGMIPGLESSRPTREGVRNVAGLGAVKISSLPHDYAKRGNIGLLIADLAVCAAEDIILQKDEKAKTFNAVSYIGLEPTDWHYSSCFVTDQDGVVTKLPPASTMRLSSAAAYQLPDISSITLSTTEQRIIDITSNADINSQLVYGLYPEISYDSDSGGMKENDNLDEATEMQRIVEANLLLSQKAGKPSILLLPQTIALDADFIRKVRGSNGHIHFVDLTKSGLDIGAYNAGDVIVTYTGHLQQTVFDHLMLQGTTLPPVIEGCNSRETCESIGRPFIHGSRKHDNLKQYKLEADDKQHLHTKASLCLEQGDARHVLPLVQYMMESLMSNPELLAYHKQRREAFLSRPDACEVAFDTLGIKYENKFNLKAGRVHGENLDQLLGSRATLVAAASTRTATVASARALNEMAGAAAPRNAGTNSRYSLFGITRALESVVLKLTRHLDPYI